MNTDTTWFNVPTFLGLPQEIQSRNDDDAAVVYDKKRQAACLLAVCLFDLIFFNIKAHSKVMRTQ